MSDLRDGRARAERALADVGLTERLWATTAQLSGGEQQRVAIARAIIREPAWILADEPTGSLDTATAGPILQLLVSIARQRLCGLVVVTHDPVVAAIADRQWRLDAGQLKVA
jgi:predicted ABC-type transport system involved in lysophospholipase L1 biosynthesis ATPase subunit